MRLERRYFLLAGIGLLSFVVGFTMHKYSYFPYPQVKSLAWKIIGLLRTPVLDSAKGTLSSGSHSRGNFSPSGRADRDTRALA